MWTPVNNTLIRILPSRLSIRAARGLFAAAGVLLEAADSPSKTLLF